VESQLSRYDAACQAHAVDQVKEVRDGAVAIGAYAQQARNKQMEIRGIWDSVSGQVAHRRADG